MDAISTITQKGQVTIPLFIRESLDLTPKQKVVFIKEKDRVFIKKAKDFLYFAGSIKTKKPFNIAKMTKEAQKYVAEKYAKNR
ncbi:hypothetical protein HY338_03835 [Candidatus Gottesmanbacteria bacterium]|nr:hypothetical protein [Candidatus Gottesmanbacteria bacterium]